LILNALRPWRSLFDECAAAQLGDRLAQLGLGIHDNRTVPHNRLIARLARHQQEALECRLICPMMS
jgi:hypothetical protein